MKKQKRKPIHLKIKCNNNLVLKVICDMHSLSARSVSMIVGVKVKEAQSWLSDEKCAYHRRVPDNLMELFLRKLHFKMQNCKEIICVKPNSYLNYLDIKYGQRMKVFNEIFELTNIINHHELGNVWIFKNLTEEELENEGN